MKANSTRFEDWPTILNDFFIERLAQPFEWGVNDCCLYACDAIYKMTGQDTAYFFRDKYKTKSEAYKLLKEFSGGGLILAVEKLTAEFNMPEYDNPLFAQRGDLVYCELESVIGGVRGMLGIISPNGTSAAIPGKTGLQYITINKVLRAWKV